MKLKIKEAFYPLHFFSKAKIFISLFAFFILFIVFSITTSEVHDSDLTRIIDKTMLVEKNHRQSEFNALQLWEAANQTEGGRNSFTTVNYEKCIPVAQCKFDDCDVEGSHDGNGHFCLPVDFSKIKDWAPDISVSAFGIPIIHNPDVYTAPVEHTQASARLPDQNNNAYFMFSNSQNYYGFIWVVEVAGIDVDNPQHITSSMPANVVWWQKLNKCRSEAECNDQYNPGNYNHPARISVIDSMAAIAFQNYSYRISGKFNLSSISNQLDGEISIPKMFETYTLPRYPSIKSADAVAFYDVSNPREPRFVRKLVGDHTELWGGAPPGDDISEVAIAKVGDYYHMNVGGTLRNYKGKGRNKGFAINYRLKFPYSAEKLSPMIGSLSADALANIEHSHGLSPAVISLNSVPSYVNREGDLSYALTLQLISSQVIYNHNPAYPVDETIKHVFTDNHSVFSSDLLVGEIRKNEKNYKVKKAEMLDDLFWMSEACKRAWGFQMLDNGGYNVICHDMNPARENLASRGRFLVRGVSPQVNLSSL